ncbi:MAG: mRNA surveillance protein pelota, partial [Candidatus Woesearchaeota archaeon]|nr:mRNA surveillance protein pelota [Candidatus Woesearchaeota archaeon]
MRLLSSDFRKGNVKVGVDNIDDLWYLSTIIDAGDNIEGQTFRKVKFGQGENQKSDRKRMFLRIKAEKIEFDASSNSLRVLGIITEGPESISHGEHHSFDIEEGTVIKIIKERWLDFQRKRLEDAAKQKFTRIMVVVLDREEAYLALLKKFGYEVLATLKGDVAKKEMESEKSKDAKNFYDEIINAIKEYDKRYNFENIIIASPAFWKDELAKRIKDDGLKKRIFLATSSSCDEKAIDEVLKRPEVNLVLKQDRITNEMKLIEELFLEISKDGLYAYGMKDVETAINMGAVSKLLVTDIFIRDKREKGQYDKIES